MDTSTEQMIKQIYRYAFLLIIGFSVGAHAACASNKQTAVEDSAAMAIQFVDRLLPAGDYQVDVLGISTINATLQEVMKKMKFAIANNTGWYQEVLRGLKPGEPIPYHENLGVTNEEYNALMKSFESVKLGKMFSVPLKVSRVEGLLKFEGGEDLHFLNQVTIDFDSRYVLIQGDSLLYRNTIRMDADNTTLEAGAWKGYTWDKEEIRRDGTLIMDAESLDITDNENLDISMYKCTVGKLDNNGQCFLHIKAMVMKKGEIHTKQDIALLISPL